MTDVARILCAIEQGDPMAAAQLLPLVYDEFRRASAAAALVARRGGAGKGIPPATARWGKLRLAGCLIRSPAATRQWYGKRSVESLSGPQAGLHRGATPSSRRLRRQKGRWQSRPVR
jgi:hypothetical protein